MRDRLPPAGQPCGHSNSPHRIAAYVFGDRSPLRLNPSVHQGHISLLHFATSKLCRQLAMRLIILGHHDQSAGLFVETMHNARPQLSADAGEAGEVMKQCIHQRPPIAFVFGGPSPHVNHHSGRLVNDRKIVILVDNVERDIFGHCS